MPNVASEPASHAPRLRPPATPPGGSSQRPSGGAFGDLLDSASTSETEQSAPPPGKSDAQTAARHAPSDAPSADDTSATHQAPNPAKAAGDSQTTDHVAGQPGSTNKAGTADAAGKPTPPGPDKTSGKGKKADKTAANSGGSDSQAPGASPVAALVAAALATPLQTEAATSSKGGPDKAAVGGAVKSKLALSTFQAAHGQMVDATASAGTQDNASDGATIAFPPQATATEDKLAESHPGDGKAADGDASADAHAEMRDAIHRLMTGDTSDAHKTETPAAAAKTTLQTSIPLPPTGSVSQTASAPSTPSTQVTSPPAVMVPLAGIPIAIAGKALAGKNHFEIRLDPPELGRIDVHLDVDKDGRLTSHLIADRKDTLDLLQRDASGLQRALQNAGLKTADSGLQFSLRDQWGNGGNGNAGQQSNSRYRDTQVTLTEETTQVSEAAPRIYGRFFSRAGGIDICI